MSTVIRNVVFDVGNVFVRWSPPTVIERCFDLRPDSDENKQRANTLLRGPLWKSLNLGKLTLEEIGLAYQSQFGLTPQETKALFFHMIDHQELLVGTVELAQRIKRAGYRMFALTDNVHEIVAYLKSRHQFWGLFEGAVVSAEVGLLKPDPAIFRHLIESFSLDPTETVFLDDVQANVDGATSIGMEARVFTTASRCEDDLRNMGLVF
jgi:putative hydrolase of the HAD superfamily